jgi:hypothetical protein
MRWDDYIRGPGLNGAQGLGNAMYPWSIVTGKCKIFLNNTYVTDRDVIYGPWVDNIELHAKNLEIPMDFVGPGTTTFTTLPAWERTNFVLEAYFFDKAEPTGAVDPLFRTMEWRDDDVTYPISKETTIDACTQARLTAVSVIRTVIGIQTFEIVSYQWARREIREVQRFGSRTGEVEWEWYTVEGQSGMRLRWVDLRQDPGNGWVTWRDRPDHAKWKEVYSRDGYVRVDGLCRLLPDNQYMFVQVQTQPLPPERCS